MNVRGKRKRKTVKEETSKLAMVTMIATGCTALFTSIALLTRHDHWSLHTLEAKHLAEALNEALNTLPSKYYDSIVGIVEKWIPWINLAFVIGAITIPRIEASSKRIEESHYKPRHGSNAGNAGEQTSVTDDSPSVGWNQ